MKITKNLCLFVLAIYLIGCKFKSTEELRPKLKKTQYRLYVISTHVDSIILNQIMVDSSAYLGPITKVEYHRLYIGDFQKKENSEIYLKVNNKDTTFRINTIPIDSLNIYYKINERSFELVDITGLIYRID